MRSMAEGHARLVTSIKCRGHPSPNGGGMAPLHGFLNVPISSPFASR
jgi:hypothetical protein